MLVQTIELSPATEAFHVSQLSFGSFGDGWDEQSFGEETDSDEDENHHSQLASDSIRTACDCIDDALALLNDSPLDEAKPKVHRLASIPAMYFDTTPLGRSRRSCDVSSKFRLLRSQSHESHDRFQLSKSEHISRSFRAPRRPSDPSEGSERVKKDPTFPAGSSHPGLDASQSSHRDVMLSPPCRTRSGSRGSTNTLSTTSAHRVLLLGSRELSSSEHLKRRLPTTPRPTHRSSHR